MPDIIQFATEASLTQLFTSLIMLQHNNYNNYVYYSGFVHQTH